MIDFACDGKCRDSKEKQKEEEKCTVKRTIKSPRGLSSRVESVWEHTRKPNIIFNRNTAMFVSMPFIDI